MSRNRERAKERKNRQRKQDGGSTPEQFEHSSFAVDEANAAVARGSGNAPGDISEAELLAAEEADVSDRGSSPSADVKRGLRFISFLRGCSAELQRVQWPDRQQVTQGTAVTLGFVVVAGLFLGGADWAAQQIVDLII